MEANEIIEKYIDSVLTSGTEPATEYAFCKEIGIEESEFYSAFGSFHSLRRKIWLSYHEETVERLEADMDTWTAYSAREKVLAYYYTLIEVLNHHRSYVLFVLNQHPSFHMNLHFIAEFRVAFKSFIGQILDAGAKTGEIAERSFINNYYDQAFWMQTLFVLEFYRKDSSDGFEKTDEAIEKAVNLAFNLIEQNSAESIIDFGKFLYQTHA